MTSVQVVVIVLVAAWLALLSLAVLLLVRQLGLIVSGMSVSGALTEDGAPIGSPVPKEAKQALPRLDRELTYLMFVSGSCAACGVVLSELQERGFEDERLHVVLAGDDGATNRLAASIPPDLTVVRGPEALAITQALRVRSTPFALQLENGIVTGKAVLRGADDLQRLIAAHAFSDAEEIASNLREVIDSVS